MQYKTANFVQSQTEADQNKLNSLKSSTC